MRARQGRLALLLRAPLLREAGDALGVVAAYEAPAYHLAVSLQRLGDAAGAASALRQYLARSAGVASEEARREEARR